MISYIIYNTYIFNHIYIYIHIQYVIGSTSDVLRKMRLQPMDDHGKDVAETCRNHGLCNLKSGNLLCSQIDCGISRTILCWGNALVPKARCTGWKEKGHVQVLWQEPKNQQACYLCDNLGAKKLVQLLKTLSKCATLRPFSEADLQFPEPPNFRVAVNWLGVLLSTIQFQDYICPGMSTCSASKIQDTELLGGRHNIIPSENAGAKHEYTLQTPAQHDFCAGKPKRL